MSIIDVEKKGKNILIFNNKRRNAQEKFVKEKIYDIL